MSDGTGTATPPAWIDSVADAEIKGAIVNAGWDKLPAHDAVAAATKSFRETQAHLGAPKELLVRLPAKPDDAEGWKAVWSRLGAGAKPEDYEFKDVTFGDTDADARYVTGFRNEALRLGMPKEMADATARFFQKNMGEVAKAQSDIAAGKLAEEKDALAKAWGPNAEANTFVAKQGAKRVTEMMTKAGMAQADVTAAVAALEGQVGYRNVLEMFRVIGTGLGEAKFVAGGAGPNGDGPMTPDQAQARLSELMADREGWAKRYMAGGAEEAKQMKALTTIIASA